MRLKFPGGWVRLSGTLVLFSAQLHYRLRSRSPASLIAKSGHHASGAKRRQGARRLLDQLVDALGGPAYLEVRERECDGRRAQFGHNGELTGFIDFKDYWRYPDKHRIDYSKKRNIIDMFNGNEGWTMDRAGVSEEPAGAVSDFQALVKYSVDNLLRYAA